ncbi:MAG: DUF1156 domain-containing protein [Candidatus Bathyarchaeia archaeon]|jgi:adenine-specific DNA methylase
MVEPAKLGRRFLEDSFPIKEVSIESAKEKMIRHGHISTLHMWWARRPLSASRTINYAALISTCEFDQMAETTNFLIELSKWKNSQNPNILRKARIDILNENGNVPPRVLDPFSGGGSLPLEALRLGCETYASDYNPVATLILKCTLEYPQKFSYAPKNTDASSSSVLNIEKENRLVSDVEKWGAWVLDEARKEIGDFYPIDTEGQIQVSYIWARTVPCQNPSCGAKIPLMRQYWLARKPNKKVALYPYVSEKEVLFKIVGSGYEPMPESFNPEKGTVLKAIATCPVCGSTMDSSSLKKLFKEGKSGQKQVAVVLHTEGTSGKKYRIVTVDDENTFKKSELFLEEKRKCLEKEWGINPVPDELTPEGKGRGAERAFSLRGFNLNEWGDLFNSRQKLALIVLSSEIREAYKIISIETKDPVYAKVITTYLAMALDRLADHNSNIQRWANTRETVSGTFTRAVLQIVWDYVEANPFSGSTGDWQGGIDWITRAIKHCTLSAFSSIAVNQNSATDLPYPNSYFDAVFTDPPYYDNVPYSYLSDFFYVWLKRTIGQLYPELFSTPLTPKSKEIVAYSNGIDGWTGGKAFFEEMLKKSFIEINRVLKPNGIAVIVYAHKSTAGWESLVNSLLDSGLVITAAWPIHTEMGARLRAMNSAALSSSIYIVARKLQKVKIGIYKDVKEELQDFLCKKMDLLWKEGVSGADFLISAIGASVMVFGKYEQILRENSVVRADVMLEDVRRIVTDYAVKQVLHNGFAAEISNLTRFYLLWRWSYGGAILPFDDARKLSQSTLVDLSHEWSKPNGVIRKQKENVCLLGPQDRNLEEIKSLEKKDLVDVLHMALLLWQKGDREALVDLLSETGLGNKDSFYRVAQAISETLPKESQEKKLIEGFLAGKERLSSETKKINVQKRLFE